MIRNWYNQIPHPAPKTKREITKYINWRQFTKGTRGKLNEQLFPSRWSFSYLKFTKLIKRSMELWEKQLHENAVIKEWKMRTYYRFKPIFKKEIYLNIIGNRDIKKSFTQFGVSAHDLSIEKGRYKNIKKNENTTCTNCQSLEIEDEFYFLIICPLLLNVKYYFHMLQSIA